MDQQIIDSIPGAGLIVAEYDGSPSFADFEVVELFLTRRGQSYLCISDDNWTFDPEEEWTPDPRTFIVFELTEITDLELAGFERQNVIGGISITRHGEGYRLQIDYCTGIVGWLVVKQIAISMRGPRRTRTPSHA